MPSTRVKYERVYLKVYASVSAARADITDYIGWYNAGRAHSSLADLTPDAHCFASCQPRRRLHKMTSPVRPELPTASVSPSQALTAAVGNFAPSGTCPHSTYKSGKAVQTNGATSGIYPPLNSNLSRQKEKWASSFVRANPLIHDAFSGRDGGIRTRDPLHPMQVRYQAALRPVTADYRRQNGVIQTTGCESTATPHAPAQSSALAPRPTAPTQPQPSPRRRYPSRASRRLRRQPGRRQAPRARRHYRSAPARGRRRAGYARR